MVPKVPAHHYLQGRSGLTEEVDQERVVFRCVGGGGGGGFIPVFMGSRAVSLISVKRMGFLSTIGVLDL